jgi:myosin heavy subunit
LKLCLEFSILTAAFSRFETSMQASNDDATAQQKSNNEILENFKKTVDQLRLDKETEIQLNNRISELRQTNEALALDKNAREREIQESTTQLDQLKQDLADCRGQLSAKNDELATALAALNNDQRLRAEIQDLETANHTVTDQLQSKNQEIAKLKEELSLLQESVRLKDQKIKDWGHRFNEAQSAIKNLNEEKIKCLAKKQQEIEKACQEARRHTAKSAEASKATLKMKLESEVNHLEQKVKEKNAELALAKEELQRARDGNDVHGENANKLQGELALYKEKFIQQIAQIKRLEEQNPGQEAFDRLAENLQSVRSECADLRNYIESIRSENSQNMEVTVRGQQAIEGNLRQVDDLEIEIEKLKENNAELQKRLEISNEAYNQPKALRGGHGDEHRSIGGAKSGQFTTALGIVPSAEQTLKVSQDPTLSSANSERLGSHSIDMNDITLDSHRVGTPEDALRKAAKSIKSHKVVSQFVPATQTSSIRKVGNFETPQIHNVLSKGTVLFSSPHVDSSSASQPQRQGSGTRPLRPAGRKYSKFGQGSGSDAGTHHLSRTETIDQDVQTVYNDNSHYSDATVSQGLLAITPFSEVASNTPTPSPFTDLSSMMDELGSVPNQEQLRKGYEQTRHSNQSEGPVTNDNAPRTVRLHTVAQRTVESLDRNEVAEANDVPRTQGRRNPPSTTEEAIRRRTAQPPKSAIKKPMQVSNADAKSTFAPKTMANTITQSKDSAGARSKDPSQIHGGRRGSYNRAVHSGKPQTPVARIPPVANESSIGALNGKQQSPQNIPLPKRNIPKRSASSIAQTQQAAKRIRTSKAVSFANGDLVPDSQENMQMT